MNDIHAQWLLLIVSLPSSSATARMRIWRNLKTLGCGALRDGVYLLPGTSPHRQALQELADETTREGGNAWLLTVNSTSRTEEEAYRNLFDRSGEYAELTTTCAEARKQFPGLSAQEINRLLRKLRREYEAVRATDFFPGEASREAELVFMDTIATAEALLSPDEPHAVRAEIRRLNPADYQGRLWATRRHLWVDRVASAWLITRFIDLNARFLWLETPADCPPDALSFDFDGATFTHVGDRVSFEVLAASFGLEHDRALAQLGALVHTLDVGEGYVPEAAGFEAVLAGVRQRSNDDDQFLMEASVILESLYAHFAKDQQDTR